MTRERTPDETSRAAPAMPHGDDDATPTPAMQAALHALRVDLPTTRDLWPGIAARLSPDARFAHAATEPWADTAASGHDASETTCASTLPPRLRGTQVLREARRPRHRWRPVAIAASLALAVGIAWSWRPGTPSPSTPVATTGDGHPMVREADAMGREYRSAFDALTPRVLSTADARALAELDRSAAEVRAALVRDPDARFLFERLQRVYALRLDLSQRFAQTG